jgi:hypothetical protein
MAYANLSQKEEFIAAGKAHGADESRESFLRTFRVVAKPKGKR